MPPKAEDLRLLLLTAKQQNNNQLTQELWLTVTQKFLDDSRTKAKSPVTSSHKNMAEGEWISYLEGLPHLEGIDVKKEIGRCQFWCSANGRHPTRRTITNWLNSDRCTRVVGYQGQGQSSLTVKAPVAASVPEPKGWREKIKDHEDLGIFATRDWDSINPYYQKLIVRLST